MTNDFVNVTIDGQDVNVPADLTIIKAAEEVGINIPSLCYHKELSPSGSCGICLVEVEGQRNLLRACTTPVGTGMNIRTHSRELRQIRREALAIILADHPDDCFSCIKNGNCELQALTKQLGVEEQPYGKVEYAVPHQIDESSPSIVREPNKCILCGRCVSVCKEVQTVFALEKLHRGFETVVAPPSEQMAESVCINCGQCVAYCPTGALHEKLEKHLVWAALEDPEKVVIVQEAPAVRVSLAEEFDMPIGINMAGKMYNAMKMLGFDYVFDTNFTADLTIMEEGSEFLARLEKGENLPLITSCSPGWVKFVETYYHDLFDNVSSCKSPQQMFGRIVENLFCRAV